MWRRYLTAAAGVVVLAAGTGATGYFSRSVASRGIETIYVVNHAEKFISDGQIRHDIPAWETAANRDFAPVWGTPQVQIKLVKSVPTGGIEALFVKNGPVQGALAYHDVQNGVPGIVVYAGVGAFYGYSNSVGFTHELFEMLADPTISQTNQGYPYPDYCLVGGSPLEGGCKPITPGTVWANEVCDPVESSSYRIDGVMISDFITPNWFNDEVRGPVDFMGVIAQPFVIAQGGYAQFWDGIQWNVVANFRHAGPDAAGFLKGEQGRR